MQKQVSDSQNKNVEDQNYICHSLGEDKEEECKLIIEDHAKMKIRTPEAEKRLSELTGQDIKLIEEPDWKLITTDKDVLESWAMAACSVYTKDSKQTEMCIGEVEKMVKGEKTLEETSLRIGKITRESPDDIAKTLITTAPEVPL